MGEPISAFDGLGELNYPYSLCAQSGVYSFHAVAMIIVKMNYVRISTITATSGQGALPQVISIPIQLAEDSHKLQMVNSGIDLVTGGYGYTSAPEGDIRGTEMLKPQLQLKVINRVQIMDRSYQSRSMNRIPGTTNQQPFNFMEGFPRANLPELVHKLR